MVTSPSRRIQVIRLAQQWRMNSVKNSSSIRKELHKSKFLLCDLEELEKRSYHVRRGNGQGCGFLGGKRVLDTLLLLMLLLMLLLFLDRDRL